MTKIRLTRMKKNKTVIKLAKNVRNYKLILHIKAKKNPIIHTFIYILLKKSVYNFT